MERFGVLLLLFCFLVLIRSEPISRPTICAEKCSVRTADKGIFRTGQTLSYEYEGQTLTTIQGSAKDHSGLRIKAKVHIDTFTPCDLAMRLSEVELHEIDPRDSDIVTISKRSTDFSKLLSQYPFHFSMNPNKHTNAYLDLHEVCVHPKESEWVTNIKKGILSTFQHKSTDITSFQKSQESDILGNCPVAYVPLESSDGTIRIRKIKELNSCTNRDAHHTSMPSSNYQSASSIQTLPIINASHVCDHVFQEDRLMLVDCKEKHLFKPMSNQEKGITTDIYQKLKFIGEEKAPPAIKSETKLQKKNLNFEHKFLESTDNKEALLRTKDVLKELCLTSKQGVQETTPELFTKLVYHMRFLKRASLEEIRNEIKNKVICPKGSVKSFFYDAMAYTGTPESNDLMIDAATLGEISPADVNSWLTGLAFQKNKPSKALLESLIPVTKHTVLSTKPQALLGLTSLVHLYCQENKENCENDEVVRKIIEPILNIFGSECQNPDSNAPAARIALRALGNAGVKMAAPLLIKCALRSENPISVRVSALQGFRRIPCSTKRTDLHPLLQNLEQDSELRIQAYLALMTCPDTETLFKVKDILSIEKINQVGSFIWTHLTNLRETSNPHKQELRQILEDSSLRAEFNLDKLQFSRNVEKSYISPVWNVGGQMESNLIWSQNSFLPRSASLNLTADLYGRAYNFLNLESRIEGLEGILEKLIGPEGYLKRTSKNTNKAVYIDALKKIEGSLGIQIFGQEISYIDLVKGNSYDVSKLTIFDLLSTLANERKIEINKNIMLSDSTISLSTGIGMPLKIDLNTTASVQMKANCKLDFFSMKLLNDLKPSAALRVSGLVSVDAGVSRYGVKLVSIVQTNTNMKAEITSDNLNDFKFNLDLPKDTQQIVSVTSDVYVVHPDFERVQVSDEIIVKDFCTNKMTEEILGVKLCSSLSYPKTEGKSKLPLAGSVKGTIFLEKTDTHSGYVFSTTLRHTPGVDSKWPNTVFKIEMNTPNSKIPRHFLVNVNLDANKRNFQVEFITPWKKALIETGLENKENNKRAVARVQIDDWDLVRIEGIHQLGQRVGNKMVDLTKFIFNVLLVTTKSITVSWKIERTGNT